MSGSQIGGVSRVFTDAGYLLSKQQLSVNLTLCVLYSGVGNQGLTQNFMSSGPQDHQLRGSGGPTIFLVVLTTTNVTTLENLEIFSRVQCVATSVFL